MVTFIEKTLKNYDDSVEDIIDKIIEQEKANYHSDLKDFTTHAREVKEQTSKQMMIFKESFLKGYEYVLENGPKYLSVPKENFVLKPKFGEGASFTEKQLARLLKASKPLQEICGYTSEMMKGIYQLGIDLYRSKDYKMCSDVNTFLVCLNPYISWFWQMLGKSYQAQEMFPEALYAFEVAINCNIYNFDGYLDAVRCCIQAKQFEEATRVIEYGISSVNVSDFPQQLDELKKNLEKLKNQLNRLVREV